MKDVALSLGTTHTHYTEGFTTYPAPPVLWISAGVVRQCVSAWERSQLSIYGLSVQWPAGPLTQPAPEIKQLFLCVVEVCCCLVLLWTSPCEGWLRGPGWGEGGAGGQTSSVKVNVKWSSAADSRKQAANWLRGGATWHINADSTAAPVHYFHFYNQCQKQLNLAVIVSFGLVVWTEGVSVQSLHILPMSEWVSSYYYCFLPKPKNVHV